MIEPQLQAVLKKYVKWSDRSRVTRMTGGASGKIFYRIAPVGDWQSVVAIAFPDSASFNTYKQVQGIYVASALPVPATLVAWPDEHLILVEDFGSATLQQAFVGLSPGQRMETYRKAVDLILQIQRLPHDRTASWPEFNDRKYRFEYETHFLSNLVEFYFEFKPTPKDRDSIGRCMNDLAEQLLTRTTVPSHRDFQSSNILITGKGLGIVDFQDSLHAHPLYDLVSLLEDVYVDLAPAQKASLFDYFLDQRSVLDSADTEDWRRHYPLITVQRKLHDAGAFARTFRLFGNPRFLAYIERALDQAMASMKSFSFLKPLHDFLNLKVKRHDEKDKSPQDPMDLL